MPELRPYSSLLKHRLKKESPSSLYDRRPSKSLPELRSSSSQLKMSMFLCLILMKKLSTFVICPSTTIRTSSTQMTLRKENKLADCSLLVLKMKTEEECPLDDKLTC
jgi:hypothetical protein